MDKKLENKVAIVTGGSGGIGLGIAKRFAAEGAQVFITGRRQPELDKAVAAIGGDVIAVRGDASNLADIDRIYESVKEKAGRIDIHSLARVAPFFFSTPHQSMFCLDPRTPGAGTRNAFPKRETIVEE